MGSAPGRRPNTVAPTSKLEIDSAGLMAMDDYNLILFADQVLSLPIKLGTSRKVILGKIYAAAMGAGCE